MENKIQQRLFDCMNYFIQKVDSGETLTEEENITVSFLFYIQDGINKPF